MTVADNKNDDDEGERGGTFHLRKAQMSPSRWEERKKRFERDRKWFAPPFFFFLATSMIRDKANFVRLPRIPLWVSV